MPLVMPLCPRCRLRACAYQRPAFYGRMPRASGLCGECLRAIIAAPRSLTDEQRAHITRAVGLLVANLLLRDPITRGADEELLILAIVGGAFTIADMAKMPVGRMAESLAATFGPSAEAQS